MPSGPSPRERIEHQRERERRERERSDPIDRILQGANAPVGGQVWSAVIRMLIQEIVNLPTDNSGNITGPRAAAAARATAWLVAAQNNSPDAFDAVFGEIGAELGLIGDTDGQQSLLDFAQASLDTSGQGRLTDTISDIQRNIDQTRTETTEIEETSETRIQEQRDVFVDIVTPEEFLDDFRTGMNTFTETLFNAGEIDVDTRRFLLQNPNLLLDSYLGALGEMADRGENIFEVVGTDFELIPIEQIGERIGPQLVQDISQTVERIERGELTIEELTKQVQQNLLSGVDAEDVQESINQTINEIFKRHGSQTTTEETVSSLLQLTTERIMQRPNLTTVRSLSPLDFLRSRFTPRTLQNLAATEPGRQQFERQQATGVAPVAPRRL